MYFNHDASGGSDGKRYTRDATILEQSCAEEPNNPRPHFYLAQTYNSLRRNSDAIRAYIKRISMTNGWMEENFMSALAIAEIMRSQLESGREVDTQVVERVSQVPQVMDLPFFLLPLHSHLFSNPLAVSTRVWQGSGHPAYALITKASLGSCMYLWEVQDLRYSATWVSTSLSDSS
eukprot:gene27968-8850_t